MKINLRILVVTIGYVLTSCINEEPFVSNQNNDQAEISLTVDVNQLSDKQLKVQRYVKERPIIAHRGTQEYAPENTAAAYRFAREVGADYIQIDLQMSKDGFLVGFRNDLKNHANITELFPGFEQAGVNHYTLVELKTMDVGSSFASSTYDRAGFYGLKILTLEEIINICEGKLEDGTPDMADTGNRPGIYIRLYEPWLNPGIEENLKAELKRLGWYADNLDNLKEINVTTGKVGVANTKGRVFLATLERSTMYKIDEVFHGELPLAFWLWKSSNYIQEDNAITYAESINFGLDYGAQFIAPNTSSYDLLKVWQSNLIKRSNAKIQAYTVNKKADMAKYTYNDLPVSQGNIYQLEYNLTNGFITNRPQYATYFYGKYLLPEELRTVPAPPFYNAALINTIFTNLGY